ncbi:MAG: twin-arginine translocase subunit TatC [Bacteroidia bacterium]|nr:twin-arginine translocase subunit TatC [Bacteroidia bacterium]
MAKLFKKAADPNTEMSFLDHLEALRWHLVRAIAAILVVAIAAFVNKNIVFDKIIFAPKYGDFLSYRALCKLSELLHIDFCIEDISFELININISGQFTIHIMVSAIAGIVLAFPYILWEFWSFIKPALKPGELKYTRGVVFFSSLLFALGVLFGYYVITPLSVNFLGGYQVSENVANQIDLSSYIYTVSVLTLASGLVFELPIVIYFLSKVGLVNPTFLKVYRKHAIVLILILAAIITPSPDIISQVIVAIPLFFLYQISIYVSAVVTRRRARELEDTD